MSGEGQDTWEARMAARAAERRAKKLAETQPPPRETWPVPPELRGYSARDVFLWYVADGWRRIFGDDPEVRAVFDHDYGHHVLRKGEWQLTLTNLKEYPERRDPVGAWFDESSVDPAVRASRTQRSGPSPLLPGTGRFRV